MPGAVAFQIPHAGHQHPLYVRYHLEQLEKQHKACAQVSSLSHGGQTDQICLEIEETRLGTNTDTPGTIPCEHTIQQRITLPIESATISTPISYDEETGMVQTAVRAIVRHPISSLVDNNMVGLSSSLVLTTGALTEVLHAAELELTHHATSSTEGLAILSLGHFLHYGREAVRQLVEYHEEERTRKKLDTRP